MIVSKLEDKTNGWAAVPEGESMCSRKVLEPRSHSLGVISDTTKQDPSDNFAAEAGTVILEGSEETMLKNAILQLMLWRSLAEISWGGWMMSPRTVSSTAISKSRSLSDSCGVSAAGSGTNTVAKDVNKSSGFVAKDGPRLYMVCCEPAALRRRPTIHNVN